MDAAHRANHVVGALGLGGGVGLGTGLNTVVNPEEEGAEELRLPLETCRVGPGVRRLVGAPGTSFHFEAELAPAAPREVVHLQGARGHAEVDDVGNGGEELGKWARCRVVVVLRVAPGARAEAAGVPGALVRLRARGDGAEAWPGSGPETDVGRGHWGPRDRVLGPRRG